MVLLIQSHALLEDSNAFHFLRFKKINSHPTICISGIFSDINQVILRCAGFVWLQNSFEVIGPFPLDHGKVFLISYERSDKM